MLWFKKKNLISSSANYVDVIDLIKKKKKWDQDSEGNLKLVFFYDILTYSQYLRSDRTGFPGWIKLNM